MRAAIVRTCLLVWACSVVGAACSGTPFCEDSRTCAPSSAGSAGDAGSGDAGTPSGGELNGSSGGGGAPTAGAGPGAAEAGSANDESGAGAGGSGNLDPVGTPCETDDECDDQDSCTGVEACVDGICEAGEAVECPVGMECSAEQNDACVFSSRAPWIVYIGNDEKPGYFEVFAVKSDLLGQMDPIKISPEPEDDWVVVDMGNWSPDGSDAVFRTYQNGTGYIRLYAVHFGDGLPEAAIHLTEGMSVSVEGWVNWSPSGQAGLVIRDDGLHVVDYVPGQPIVETRVSPPGFTELDGSLKNDDELIWVGRSSVSQKSQIARAVRQGQIWVQDPLVTDLSMVWGGPIPGGALAFYMTQEQGKVSLFELETVMGAQPVKIAGPANDIAPAGSHDFTYLMIATSASTAKDSTIFGGGFASASALPILKEHVALFPHDVLQNLDPFAPDVSQAALFQAGSFGRQLVLFDPHGAGKWTPIAVEQTSANDGQVLWSPDSKLLALPTRTSAGSAFKLTLVSALEYGKRDLDTIQPGELPWGLAKFSPEGEFFFYAYGPTGEERRGAYVDLRRGISGATVHEAEGTSFRSWSLPRKGTDALYLQGDGFTALDCFHVSLSGEVASEPVRVNGGQFASACTFQPLP